MVTDPASIPAPSTAAGSGAEQARRAAAAASSRAGVTMSEAVAMTELLEASALLESVWGRTDEGVPVNSEVLRQLVHAGGAVTMARDADGRPAGAAVLAVAAPAGSTYSMIAATAPGHVDRGIGAAIKLRQRAWALDHGFASMRWTFDPLVSRNARFNLVTLGAEAVEYVPSFYGRMNDALNTGDDSDRLVVHWQLDSRRADAAAQGVRPSVDGPAETSSVLRAGPDGQPVLRRDDSGLWCRIPHDVVTLRRTDPVEASRWRRAVRELLTEAFADDLVATQLSRGSWYLLTAKETP